MGDAAGELSYLREAFMKIDRDKDGMISLEELKASLNDFAESDVEDIFLDMDQTGEGMVSYTEFLAAMMKRSCFLNPDRMADVFKFFDSDGNGIITSEDLKRSLGDHVGPDHINKMIEEGDLDGNGSVSREEWMHVMLGTTPDFGDPEELLELMCNALECDREKTD